ncbi:unnamed protein product, partial [Mesorhabditis belari]|uniref:Uncharacterized protein n=1 Tax=Mesorhabditis belari TaxID=2138241 RepID=A0AAF3F2S4_9BILA
MYHQSRKRPTSDPYHDRLRKKISKLGPLPITAEKPFFQRDIKGHYGCVNSVEFSHNQDFLASGGDDQRVLLWSVSDMLADANPKPIAEMDAKHLTNIFAYSFSNDDKSLFSGGNDGFAMLHNLETNQRIRAWYSYGPVFNLCCSPIDVNLVTAARDCGEVAFYDLRSKENENNASIKMKSSATSVYSGQFNPDTPHVFAVCSDNEGLCLYDTRFLDKKMLDLQRMAASCMYGEFNSSGQRMAINRFRESPIVVDLLNNSMIRLKDERYESSQTIKSIHFADDDTVMIGSDNFDIYAWKIPVKPQKSRGTVNGIEVFEVIEEATAILKGHRSIVNHVRYNSKLHVLASCGVEKIVKLWSPLEMRESTLTPNLRPITPRHNHNGIMLMDLIQDVQEENENNIEEDLEMLRHFDRLILRARIGSNDNTYETSDDDDSSREYLHDYNMGYSEDTSSSNENNDGDEEVGVEDGDGDGEAEAEERGFIRRLNSPSAIANRHVRYWDVVEDEQEAQSSQRHTDAKNGNELETPAESQDDEEHKIAGQSQTKEAVNTATESEEANHSNNRTREWIANWPPETTSPTLERMQNDLRAVLNDLRSHLNRFESEETQAEIEEDK